MSEYYIGPFEHGEAVDHIKDYALALTNLGLQKRFTVLSTPRCVIEHERRRDGHQGRRDISYQVVLVDKCPDEPKPEGLTALQIKAAEAAGYTQPTVKYYEALGQRMTMNQWAKAVGVSWPTLKSRIDRGLTMEEAITEIALKKAA